jgi:hypothetical protein
MQRLAVGNGIEIEFAPRAKKSFRKEQRAREFWRLLCIVAAKEADVASNCGARRTTAQEPMEIYL